MVLTFEENACGETDYMYLSKMIGSRHRGKAKGGGRDKDDI